MDENNTPTTHGYKQHINYTWMKTTHQLHMDINNTPIHMDKNNVLIFHE